MSVLGAFAEGETILSGAKGNAVGAEYFTQPESTDNESVAEFNDEAIPTANTLALHAEILKAGYINRDVTLAVYDGEVMVAEKSVTVKNDDLSFFVQFDVPEYKFGKTFTVKVTSGDAEAEYNGTRGTAFNVQPYIYADSDGNQMTQTVFYINLHTGAQARKHTVYFSGEEVGYPYYLCGDEIYMDERMLGDLRIERVNDGESLTLFVKNGDFNISMQFFKDNVYALNNWAGYNLKHAAFMVDGIFYFPLSDVANVFKCGYEVTDAADKRDIKMSPSQYASNALEDIVNNGGYESKTNRLIWISKKDFKVHLFKGTKGSWTLEGSYPCSIGTDSTPTIEGQFEYIERLNRWNYADFYCGPVMRFYNGYALHSTLIRYDGTFYDNRVGMKLSHGCIRLHPEDINYLVEVVPFYTKILITA